MKSVRSFVLLTILTLLSAPIGIAQEKTTEQLGKVTFPTSCDPKVQAQFERGVAMLHSYWFTEGGKVFDAVAKQDPNCVMAYGATPSIYSVTRWPVPRRRKTPRRLGRRSNRRARSARKRNARATGSKR